MGETFTLNGKNDITISLKIEGITLNFLTDSGTSVNAIDKSQSMYDQIKTTENILQHPDAKIYPYDGNSPLKLFSKTKLKTDRSVYTFSRIPSHTRQRKPIVRP